MRRDAQSLIDLVQKEIVFSPCKAAEIGVWKGHTSVELLKAFDNMVLYCVDPWENSPSNPTMIKTVDELKDARIECLKLLAPYADRVKALMLTSQQASKLVADGVLDFAYIDACHLYESVKQDINLWWPKVRSGGILCGHDYDGVGDRRGRFGVKKAVDEWGGTTIRVARANIWWTQKQ